MARGRKAEPPALRILKGTESPDGTLRDSGGREIEPTKPWVRFAPEPPEWLDGEALAEWRRVVPELERLEILRPVDRAVLSAYCVAWARFVDLAEQIKHAPATYETDTGWRKNPLVSVFEGAARELRAFASEYGLTPAAEMKVGGRRGDEANELDADPFGAAGSG